MQSIARSTVPSPVAATYNLFYAMAQEKKWKITTESTATHTLTFKVVGYNIDYEAVFTPLLGNQTQLVLTGTHSGAVDYSESITANFIEPFISLVNAKVHAEAETTLAGTNIDEVLFSTQPVTPEVEKLLKELQSGLSAYNRRDAAKALGALTETNERIVAVLLLARETDAHDAVKSGAAQALQSPGAADVLEHNPEWVNKVLALSRINKTGTAQVEQQVRANNRSATAMIGSGFTLIIAGIIGLLLPLVGYQLIFRGIPTGQPIVAGAVAVVGALLLVAGYHSRK
ncbi:MAG: HEAT repeat domain-containing protein [Anaerolineae bacterium]